MTIASRSLTIHASAEALWQKLVGVEGWPLWLRAPYASQSVSLLSAGPPGLGCEFAMKGRLRACLFARITAWEPRTVLAYEVFRSEYPSDRLFFERAVITVRLAPSGPESTAVTCTHELVCRGLLGRLYASTIMRPLIRGNVRTVLESLAVAVESER